MQLVVRPRNSKLGHIILDMICYIFNTASNFIDSLILFARHCASPRKLQHNNYSESRRIQEKKAERPMQSMQGNVATVKRLLNLTVTCSRIPNPSLGTAGLHHFASFQAREPRMNGGEQTGTKWADKVGQTQGQ